MKTSKFNSLLLSVTLMTAIAVITLITGCSGSPVNQVTATIDNYAQSVTEATTIGEIQELDGQFAEKMAKYSDSDYRLTPADRKTLMKSISALSQAVNTRMIELSGVEPIDDLPQREAAFKTELDRCVTMGDFINMGL